MLTLRVESHPLSIVLPVLLTQEQVRILGCLIEKARTTPVDYPLTANSIMRAANQSTSRDPVVTYDQHLIEANVIDLKDAGLLRFVHSPSNRATKYRHVLGEAWGCDDNELAVLCVLMLRGPQTVAELKSRTERLASFRDLESVEAVLADLAARPEPMVALGERAPGQKEPRWIQLVGEAPEPSEYASWGSGAGRGPSGGTGERIERLEVEVERLSGLIEELRRELGLEPGISDPVHLSDEAPA